MLMMDRIVSGLVELASRLPNNSLLTPLFPPTPHPREMDMNAWPENAGEKDAWVFRMEVEKESRLMLLRKVRLACEQLAAPSSETVESLLRLVLGGGEEASPLELEAGLRSLGLCPTPLELQQLLSMFGVPCLAGAPNVDVGWLIDVVLQTLTRVAAPPQLENALPPTAAEMSRLPMPSPFATDPSFVFTPRDAPVAETPRTGWPTTAAGVSRSDLVGGVAGLLLHADLADPSPTKTPRGRGASLAASAAGAAAEAPFALDGCARGAYDLAASASERAAGEKFKMGTCEAPRYRGGPRRSSPSAARPTAAPSCEPPFAVFTDDELYLAERGGWGAVPARSRAANQWTAAVLADRRDEPRAQLWRGDAAAAGVSSGLPSETRTTGLPLSGGPEAGGELLSVSASWLDRSARPSSRGAGLRPRTASQLTFG